MPRPRQPTPDDYAEEEARESSDSASPPALQVFNEECGDLLKEGMASMRRILRGRKTSDASKVAAFRAICEYGVKAARKPGPVPSNGTAPAHPQGRPPAKSIDQILQLAELLKQYGGKITRAAYHKAFPDARKAAQKPKDVDVSVVGRI